MLRSLIISSIRLSLLKISQVKANSLTKIGIPKDIEGLGRSLISSFMLAEFAIFLKVIINVVVK